MDETEPIGTESSATLVNRMENAEEARNMNDDDSNSSSEDVVEKRDGWDNKVQYILAQIGFAVGLGNVWRFPYLCQKNGGGAFLIPYFIMLILEGIPLFYMEIAIGQRLKRGSVGVWNHIHPYLGGVGVASMVVCFLIALYYNMIIAWALYYFFNSFQSSLPWSDCPSYPNLTDTNNKSVPLEECSKSSATSYFWYRDTLDISSSIEEPGNVVWRLSLVLVVAWLVVFIGMFKGIKSSGKIIYFSATFPYLVLVIYFFRGITLDGAVDGLAFMFTPDMSKLADPNVWRDAATQIFFSLGLGFGGVIAYSSYNDVKNNCKKDAITVSIINCASSLFASLVIFCVLGFKAHHKSQICIDRNIEKIHGFFNDYPDHDVIHFVTNMDRKNYYPYLDGINITLINHNETQPSILENWKSVNLSNCTIEEELKEAVSGPGLAFIAFTEAMIHMPGGPFWSVMFFAMLINLGLGSMFGTLEGIVTPLRDLGLKIPKEAIVAILCLVSLGVGQIFTLRSGMYILDIFDTYAGTLPLLMIAFFETVGVAWVYKFSKFSKDISYMLDESGPGPFWRITWCFISPLLMAVLFIASIVQLVIKTPQYKHYNAEEASGDEKVDYPAWAIAFIIFLILLSISWIPIIAFLRWKGYLKYVPADSSSKAHPTNKSYA
ncbi:sodium-dependent neutral amino acid transporter B(0)AT3-like [Clavelina lepadiformis]|uniref:Transporter n=1 Tax=Clavelina lepadiformis TaxID=159417 RepID=A0ABP0FUT2_CLALP